VDSEGIPTGSTVILRPDAAGTQSYGSAGSHASGSPGFRKEIESMRNLSQFVVDFLKREDGPTAVEYAQ
jgi:hypothetical protein